MKLGPTHHATCPHVLVYCVTVVSVYWPSYKALVN